MRFRCCAFTVMAPDLTPEACAQTLASLGFDGVEWRVTAPSPPDAATNYWTGNLCTIDINRLDEEASRVRLVCGQHGLQIPALGTYVSAADRATVRRCMAFAADVGCPQIRVGVPPYDGTRSYNQLYEEAVEHLDEVAALAKEYGVRANVELHMGSICPSASMAHRLLARFDPQYVGAIYDPGNMVAEGMEAWQMGMELLGPYLAHVHVKNSRWEVASRDGSVVRWRHAMCPLREGVVDWPQVLAALRRVGYTGWLSFEDFGPGGTVQKLGEDLAYMRSIESAGG